MERRIRDLELDLGNYHAALEDAVRSNAEFNLNASWGLMRGLTWFVFAGTLAGVSHYLKLKLGADAWIIADAAGFVAAAVAAYAWVTYNEKGFESDKKHLWVPGWRKMRDTTIL
jgi:hypothetical protein